MNEAVTTPDEQHRRLRSRLRLVVCAVVAVAVLVPQTIAVVGLNWERNRLLEENAQLRQMVDVQIPKLQQQINELEQKVSAGGPRP